MYIIIFFYNLGRRSKSKFIGLIINFFIIWSFVEIKGKRNNYCFFNLRKRINRNIFSVKWVRIFLTGVRWFVSWLMFFWGKVVCRSVGTFWFVCGLNCFLFWGSGYLIVCLISLKSLFLFLEVDFGKSFKLEGVGDLGRVVVKGAVRS